MVYCIVLYISVHVFKESFIPFFFSSSLSPSYPPFITNHSPLLPSILFYSIYLNQSTLIHLCLTLPYLTLPYLTLTYLTLLFTSPYLILPYLTLLYLTLPYLTLLFLTLPSIPLSLLVIWNGPMGVFEFDAFARGTNGIATTLAELTGKGCITIIGGGGELPRHQISNWIMICQKHCSPCDTPYIPTYLPYLGPPCPAQFPFNKSL